jgi:hypothetical protein
MADRVLKANYCYLTLSNRAGQGEKVLGELKDAGVNLLAFTAFPIKGGKAQVDLVAENLTSLKRVARKNGWRLSKTKKGFLIQGDERIGAVHRQVKKLADEKINITAADAMCAGKGRYGMLMWVKPKDYARAARILKAK